MMEPGRSPEATQVAVAIVTSRLGVLVGRRRDETPPWTFPGGKIEPGESPEAAAVLETLEDRTAGPGYRGDRQPGEPADRVRIVYVAAVPMPKAFDLADTGRELAEVRWASLAEAGELMVDMFVAVREYLQRMLGG